MILGADVGYSNLKLAAGLATATSPDITTHMPAGAGPVSALPESLGGGHMRDGIIVSVQDQPWVAGVEPYRLHGVTRDLHDDYTTSRSYRALMLAAMQFPGHQTLSALVTGLPVKHFQDRERRLTLAKRLRGQHNLGQGKRVTVQKTFILPQPIGAFIDATAHTHVDHELLAQGRVLIVDAGFFSFDWAVVEEMGLVSQVSGTSLQAMSRLLDRTNQILVERYGDGLGVERLEAAVRAQRRHVTLFGKKILLAPILEQASRDTAEVAMKDLRQAQRGERPADMVIITGGGADYFKEPAKALFEKSTIFVPDEPWLANARGFWRFGRRHVNDES